MTQSHIEEPDYFLASLAPLLQGQSVKLVVEQEKWHGQIRRLVQKGLLIAPGEIYGFCNRTVVVSLLGSGSCVIFVDRQESKSELVRSGLQARLASALLDSLKKLYGETTNGSAKTRKTRPCSRS